MQSSLKPSVRPWMIYGANGYTGKLIACEAKNRGLNPILAGRSPRTIQKLGTDLGFETRCFDLRSSSEIAQSLVGVQLVLHCAGPFQQTSEKMLQGCMQARAHYLDITGEIPVFESIFTKDPEIKRAQIIAIPGVGFDVVPTDCVAALLKKKLPDANRLILGIQSSGRLSPGTLATALGSTSELWMRKDGKIVPPPEGYKILQIPFGRTLTPGILLPWGDVSTAYHSTGIPDIEVYMAAKPGMAQALRVLALASRIPGVQKLMQKLAQGFVKGPDQNVRKKARANVWGQVQNAAGKTESMGIVMGDPYDLTVDSALTAVQRVLDVQKKLPPGAWTPSQIFGADFVLSLKDVKVNEAHS